MSRSRRVSATTSLPKPAVLVPEGIGRSIAAVSRSVRGLRAWGGDVPSRIDIGLAFRAGDAARSNPIGGRNATGLADPGGAGARRLRQQSHAHLRSRRDRAFPAKIAPPVVR